MVRQNDSSVYSGSASAARPFLNLGDQCFAGDADGLSECHYGNLSLLHQLVRFRSRNTKDLSDLAASQEHWSARFVFHIVIFPFWTLAFQRITGKNIGKGMRQIFSPPKTCDFQWKKCPDGYEFYDAGVDLADDGDLTRAEVQWLKQNSPLLRAKSQTRIELRPLDVSETIARELADATTTDKVLNFANNYGELGLLVAQEGMRVRVAEGDAYLARLVANFGEPFIEWKRAAQELRHAFQIWDLLEGNQIEKIRRMMAPTPPKNELRDHLQKLKAQADAQPHQRALSGAIGLELAAIDAMSPAIINPEDTSLRNYPVPPPASTRLSADQVRTLARQYLVAHFNRTVQATPRLSIVDGQFRIDALPRNLLSAAWLQLGETAGGKIKQIQCPDCGKWVQAQRKTKQRCKVCRNRRKSRDCYNRKTGKTQLAHSPKKKETRSGQETR